MFLFVCSEVCAWVHYIADSGGGTFHFDFILISKLYVIYCEIKHCDDWAVLDCGIIELTGHILYHEPTPANLPKNCEKKCFNIQVQMVK